LILGSRLIHIVEDDGDIREIVRYALRSSGYDTEGFENGAGFLEYVYKNPLPSLILLDIMLPGEDGFAVLKKIRAASMTKFIPVIMLTAKGGEYDKVKGLDSGADDYISKPFGVMELISRVNAVLRRSFGFQEKSETFSCGGISLDNSKREVSVNGREVRLTYKEYELLYYLMLNSGIVLNREKILSEIWGFDFEGESRTLDMHVKTLRAKLKDAGKLIKTYRNVGFKLGD